MPGRPDGWHLGMDLDNLSLYPRLDPSGMEGHLRGLPQQCRQAWEEARALELPAHYARCTTIVIAGMGGSAIAGDFIQALAAPQCPVPIVVHRDYGLPAFVDENTLLIVSSYSGQTEETLSGFEEGMRRGAKVVALTSGGGLGRRAQEAGLPLFTIKYRASPRATLGLSLMFLLAIMQRLGFMPDPEAAVADAISAMERLLERVAREVPQAQNPAKALAAQLLGREVAVYGAGHLGPVARRWKTQLNENAKAWAGFDLFPELNHNMVVGYEFPADLAERVFVVLLWAPTLGPRLRARYQVTQELLRRAGIPHREVETLSTTPLAQAMGMTLLGDYVSYYLALLNGVDPTPVKTIDYLKERLASA